MYLVIGTRPWFFPVRLSNHTWNVRLMAGGLSKIVEMLFSYMVASFRVKIKCYDGFLVEVGGEGVDMFNGKIKMRLSRDSR